MRAASNALQVYGGYGHIDEYPVGKPVRDARVMTRYEGTSRLQELITRRAPTAVSAFWARGRPGGTGRRPRGARAGADGGRAQRPSPLRPGLRPGDPVRPWTRCDPATRCDPTEAS